MPIEGIADRLGVADLRRTGAELVGPCPKCGGTDRFGINVQRHVFNCRTCGGGDGIGLVRHVLGCDFRAALDWLCGERDVVLDPAEAHRRMQRAEAEKKKRARDALRYRQRATAQARDIWQAGVDPAGTAVEAYLSGRGLADLFGPWPPKCIRFHADLAFMWKDGGGEWKAIHRGPAMLAAIQGPNGKFSGVHRTWLDPQEPKGKAAIVAPDGTAQKSKKTWGAKKGGTIRLVTPPGAGMMVMGEGIETTATALVAGGYDAAAYWCGVDLGNMAGRRESGKGLKFAGLPNMGSDAGGGRIVS